MRVAMRVTIRALHKEHSLSATRLAPFIVPSQAGGEWASINRKLVFSIVLARRSKQISIRANPECEDQFRRWHKSD